MLAGPALGPTISRAYFRYIIMGVDFLGSTVPFLLFSLIFGIKFMYQMSMKYVKFQLMHYLLFFQQLDSVVLYTDLVYPGIIGWTQSD